MGRKFLIISRLLRRIGRCIPQRIALIFLKNTSSVPGYFGLALRYLFLSGCALEIGLNVRIGRFSEFRNVTSLSIGHNVSINEFAYIDAAGGLTIGDNTACGARLTVITSSHGVDIRSKVPFKYQPMQMSSVNIGSNVWLGSNVTILYGSKIPSNSVVGASSLVNKALDQPRAVYVGTPAKLMRML